MVGEQKYKMQNEQEDWEDVAEITAADPAPDPALDPDPKVEKPQVRHDGAMFESALLSGVATDAVPKSAIKQTLMEIWPFLLLFVLVFGLSNVLRNTNTDTNMSMTPSSSSPSANVDMELKLSPIWCIGRNKHKCYQYILNPMAWKDHVKASQSIKMGNVTSSLATFETTEQADFVARVHTTDFPTLIIPPVQRWKCPYPERTGDVWIGAQRRATEPETQWEWLHSSSPTYTRWSPGEPNNYAGSENCLSLEQHGNWNDADCRLFMPALIQFTL